MVAIKINEQYFEKFNADGSVSLTADKSKCAKYKSAEKLEAIVNKVTGLTNNTASIVEL